MRILFLHDRLTAKGGADRYLIGLIDHLRRLGLETLLGFGLDDGSVPKGQHELLGPLVRLKGLEGRGLKQKGRQAASRRLAELLEQEAFDLIHVHNVMDPELIRLAAASGRAVMTVQDHRLFCPGQGKVSPLGAACDALLGPACGDCLDESRYGNRLLALTKDRLMAAGGMAAIHVLSSYMADQLQAAWHQNDIKAPSIHVIPPFVHNIDHVLTTEKRRHHLLACRLVERKGVRVALKASELLTNSLSLIIAGDGTLASETAQAAEESQGRVIYAGWAGRREMARLLGGAVSLWLPSLWAEPFGIVGLEALSLGVPVIASSVGGVTDWLDPGVNGLLVEPGDPAALARAADDLASDADLASRLGQAGRQVVRERYDTKAILDRVTGLYAKVAGM